MELTIDNWLSYSRRRGDYICGKCLKEYQSKYYKENRDKFLAYRQGHKEQILRQHKEYYKKNKVKIIRNARLHQRKIRLEVLTHYGGDPPKCAHCGIKDIRVLTIDHIKGFKNSLDYEPKEKSQDRKTGNDLYNWLIKNDFPEGYQVLCWNCNYLKLYKNNYSF